ncbi:ABC transporter permease [Acuticoccus kandeliae]|uniref:ABC transporter permease n=1 Tax=Acuticoccus kandeliae TaxID=2073160 RepID=UPI000D3E6F99|nr:ABC transporter permease [Acuticoccus kandeliae]
MSALGRLGQLVTTLFVASVLIFVAMQVLPGDPAEVLLGMNADPAAIAALRTEMGLDRPLVVQFTSWLGGVLTGDFGVSATYEVPVSSLIVERAVVSVPLALLAVTISIGLALPVGIFAAVRRGRGADRAAMGAALIGLSVPNMWLGLMLIYVFAVLLGVSPAGGFPGWEVGIGRAFGALWMPAVALALPQAAILTRIVRTSVVEAMDEDYVALARAKGRSVAGAVIRHALPNAWAPILTIIGLQFGFLVSGAVVIETVFSLPGIGRLLFQAVSQRDLMVVAGVVFVLVAAVVVINSLCDLLAAWLNPRQRADLGGGS